MRLVPPRFTRERQRGLPNSASAPTTVRTAFAGADSLLLGAAEGMIFCLQRWRMKSLAAPACVTMSLQGEWTGLRNLSMRALVRLARFCLCGSGDLIADCLCFALRRFLDIDCV